MCGIFGVIGEADVTGSVLGGLKKLEYRGYDSAGIAVSNGSDFDTAFAQGKLQSLEKLLLANPLTGMMGIGHTRWATHGAPTIINAHPHVYKRVAVVHNGIIENHKILRNAMKKLGHEFNSETDSEVIPHLINHYLELGFDKVRAVRNTLKRLEGTYALGILIEGEEEILAARKGSPLVIGKGETGHYLASDTIALGASANEVMYLENDDLALIKKDGVLVFDKFNKPKIRQMYEMKHDEVMYSKGEYDHFMMKEIEEQPQVIRDTCAVAIDDALEKMAADEISKLYILACGTSYYAASVGKYWLEKYTGLDVEVDIASEFRYREKQLDKKACVMVISQSGETADTLAALRESKEKGLKVGSIVNVQNSSIARESDFFIPTQAGVEIGVASTKAFTAQLVVLVRMALQIARNRSCSTVKVVNDLEQCLLSLPAIVEKAVADKEVVEKMAEAIQASGSVYFLGRGISHPMAMEGALKLKEISYIHAEGYPAGELKHGPIALIEKGTPVVVICPDDRLFEKTLSNIQEVSARGADIYFIGGGVASANMSIEAAHSICLPNVDADLSPFVAAVYLQLLAYFVALKKGTDIDQPRNLAKAVTVE